VKTVAGNIIVCGFIIKRFNFLMICVFFIMKLIPEIFLRCDWARVQDRCVIHLVALHIDCKELRECKYFYSTTMLLNLK
jgi:hypothetical protein